MTDFTGNLIAQAHGTRVSIDHLVQHGRVEEADAERAQVRVRIGDPDNPQGSLLTGWILWAPLAASDNHVTQWDMPAVGETVMVVCPSGNVANAVVALREWGRFGHPPITPQIPHPFRPGVHPVVAAPDTPDLDDEELQAERPRRGAQSIRLWGDGSWVRYDRIAGELLAVMRDGTVLRYHSDQKLLDVTVFDGSIMRYEAAGPTQEPEQDRAPAPEGTGDESEPPQAPARNREVGRLEINIIGDVKLRASRNMSIEADGWMSIMAQEDLQVRSDQRAVVSGASAARLQSPAGGVSVVGEGGDTYIAGNAMVWYYTAGDLPGGLRGDVDFDARI